MSYGRKLGGISDYAVVRGGITATSYSIKDISQLDGIVATEKAALSYQYQ